MDVATYQGSALIPLEVTLGLGRHLQVLKLLSIRTGAQAEALTCTRATCTLLCVVNERAGKDPDCRESQYDSSSSKGVILNLGRGVLRLMHLPS